MFERFLKNKIALITTSILLLISLVGIFAPLIAPNDPYETAIINKFAEYSAEYPLGTDQLGRCVLSRIIYGIRPTLGLAFLTMLGTIGLGATLGVSAAYRGGRYDEFIMRLIDVMLAFPSQIMVFAVIALLGIDVKNVVVANVLAKWAWYGRIIRAGVIEYKDSKYVEFARISGISQIQIFIRHLLPSISSDLFVLASLDIGWAIINISTLSFLGMGVTPPTSEWGVMLNEAKNVMTTNPRQMLAPGLAIVLVVTCFNLLGDAFRDVFDPKEEMQ